MNSWGLEWQSLDTYFQFEELASSPSTPEGGHIRLYAKDNGSGVSQFCYKNDAGTEICLPTSGAFVTGTGTSGQVAFWNGTSTLTGDTDLTFATATLTATNIVVPTNLTLSSMTLGSVLFAGTAGLVSQDNTAFFWNNTDNKLHLGSQNTHTGTNARLTMDSDTQVTLLELSGHHTTGPAFQWFFSRDTHGSPAIVQADDRLVFILGNGYGGSNYHNAAAIQFLVDGTPGNNDMPGRIAFYTTPDGSATLSERFRVGAAGQWGIGGATFGTSGQVFTSGGASAAPTWTTPSASVDDAARVYNNASQTINNNSFTALAFQVEEFDTNTMHDNSTDNSRITIATAGRYHVTASTRWAINGTGERVISIRKNGVATDLLVNSVRGNGTSRDRFNVSGTLTLAATDYIEAFVLHDISGGGTLDVESSGQETSFEAVFVGD